MQVASILSDLTSLRVCDHSAALALVSVHKPDVSPSIGDAGEVLVPEQDSKPHDDPDMQRATDLVELHYGVKMNHMQGEGAELKQARMDVDRALKTLEGKESRAGRRRG